MSPVQSTPRGGRSDGEFPSGRPVRGTARLAAAAAADAGVVHESRRRRAGVVQSTRGHKATFSDTYRPLDDTAFGNGSVVALPRYYQRNLARESCGVPTLIGQFMAHELGKFGSEKSGIAATFQHARPMKLSYS